MKESSIVLDGSFFDAIARKQPSRKICYFCAMQVTFTTKEASNKLHEEAF